jgi:RNA polymerase sigma-70 factor, ECF subfamily
MAADADLVDRLRSGDEKAFVELVGRYQDSMLRLARTFVSTSAVAEEVVQDTWLGVLRGLDRYEGRGSLKAWMFQILVNRARTSGVREHRSVPIGDSGHTVDQARFDATGAWISPPQHWSDAVVDRLFADKAADRIHRALEELPPGQRQVVTLRDVEGLTSTLVCDLLDISEGNQRVLLHRGRAHLRQILEAEFGEG